MTGTDVVDGPADSTDANAFRFEGRAPRWIADAPSVMSDMVSGRGATDGRPRSDSNPADVIVLPAPPNAVEARDGADSVGALSGGTRGISSDVSGPFATLTEEAVPDHDDAPDRAGPNGRGAGAAADLDDAESGRGTGSPAASPLESDPDLEASSLDRIVDELSDPSTWIEGPTTDLGSLPGGASSIQRTVSPGATDSYGPESSADAGRSPRKDSQPTVIALPDLSGDAVTDIDDGYLRQLAGAPAVSSDRNNSDESEFDDLSAHDAPSQPDQAAAKTVDGGATCRSYGRDCALDRRGGPSRPCIRR